MRHDHETSGERSSSRRAFLRTSSVVMTTAALAATGTAANGDAARATPLSTVQAARSAGSPPAVTPACGGHETPAATEGPLFKAESPERGDFLTPGTRGVRLDLGGVVYDTACKPLAGTLIEFWQCDQNGDYDTSGFALRGHQYTDSKGAFRLTTIIPRDYWGRWGQRAPHIHAQVQASGGPVLVTQLYFPDDTQAYGRDFAALNAADQLFNRACVITLTGPKDDSYTGAFDFVIQTTAQ